MKLNRFLRVAAALWIGVLLTTALLPGTTLARFNAGANAQMSARVARWHVWIPPQSGTASPMFRPRFWHRGIAFRNQGIPDGTIAHAWQEFSVRNDSEVAVRYTIFVLYSRDRLFDFGTVTNPETGAHSTPGVPALRRSEQFTLNILDTGAWTHMTGYRNAPPEHYSPAVIQHTTAQGRHWVTGTVPPGRIVWFQLHFVYPNVAMGQKCRLYVIAEQVD